MTDLPIVIRGARHPGDLHYAGMAVESVSNHRAGQFRVRTGDRLCAITIMRTQVRVDMSEWVDHD